MNKTGVLFLCTANSARSPMAVALLRRRVGGSFEIYSAGLHPTEVHPLTHCVLNEVGIETSTLRAKGIKELLGKITVRYAIIVCSKAAEACPHIYPFALQVLNWPFEDPAASEGTPAERLAVFRKTRDLIDSRLCAWLEELEEQATGGVRR